MPRTPRKYYTGPRGRELPLQDSNLVYLITLDGNDWANVWQK